MFDGTSVTTIGVVTANRPALVRRCLDSLVRHCDLHGRRPRFLVIDGSKAPADQAATRSAVSEVADASGHRLEYFGLKEANRLRSQLQVHDEIGSVLVPGSTGANRNLLLLLTAGEHILAVDDDVVVETWSATDRDDGLALMGHHQELFETTFFSDRATALNTVARSAADLFSAHEALLGHSLSALVARSSPAADMTRACGHLRSALEEGRPLVVRATFTGLAGDAGVYCPYRLLFSGGPLRQLLLTNASMFQTALTSREASRIVHTSVVTHDCGCMAPCMGLANREVVPPFMPTGRNEDGVFGVMLAASDATTVFGHVPVGVLHDSDRPSARPAGPILSASASRLSDFIISVVMRSRLPEASTPDAWLREIGHRFIDLAELSGRDIAAYVSEMISEERSLELAQIAEAVDGENCPKHWRDGLTTYRDQLLASMTTEAFYLPTEFHGAGTVEEGFDALRAFMRGFGRLIDGWPDLWVAARALNANADGRSGPG